MVKVQAFGKWVLLVPVEPRARASGLIVPRGSADGNDVRIGKVASFGDECCAVFGKEAMLKVGDTVLFNGRAARDVVVNEVKSVMVPAVEVYGRATDDDDKR